MRGRLALTRPLSTYRRLLAPRSMMNFSGLPTTAPERPKAKLRYADVAVTATAKEFGGIYRGKQYHPADMNHVLDRALEASVEKVMLTGMSLSDVPTNLDIARGRPAGSCFVTIGVHPYHAAEPAERGLEYLEKLKEHIKDELSQRPSLLSAFGELGLDYDRLNHADKDVQLATFKAQLDLFVAEKWDLPLFLHCRAAFDDFVETMTPYIPQLPRSGLVHSFVGTKSQMEQLVVLGLDVSVNGFSFQDQDSLEMVAAIPLDKLQIETDAPWGEIKASSEVAKRYLAKASPLPPSKKKDKWDAACMVKERNESCMIERVAYVVAGLQGTTVDKVAEAAWKNSIAMFRLGDVPSVRV